MRRGLIGKIFVFGRSEVKKNMKDSIITVNMEYNKSNKDNIDYFQDDFSKYGYGSRAVRIITNRENNPDDVLNSITSFLEKQGIPYEFMRPSSLTKEALKSLIESSDLGFESVIKSKRLDMYLDLSCSSAFGLLFKRKVLDLKTTLVWTPRRVISEKTAENLWSLLPPERKLEYKKRLLYRAEDVERYNREVLSGKCEEEIGFLEGDGLELVALCC